jgi:hypothetical protein
MKRQVYYAVAIFIGLSVLFSWVVYMDIPTELLVAIDKGFDWNAEGDDVQVTLANADAQPGFVVTVKNVSNKVISLRKRVKVTDSSHRDISDRGEGAFQLFMLNSSNDKVSLHQYSNLSLGAVTEQDTALNPGQQVTFNYRVLPSDNDLNRIGAHSVIAGVRYFEIDPKSLSEMSEETKDRQIGYVNWSNVAHLPDTQ